MILKPLTAGLVSGTDLVACGSQILGGINIRADGSNAATVTIRKDSATGTIIYQAVTLTPQFAIAPIEASSLIYYTISGTNASAQLYEWII